jgi:serine phosphatase RsbU (regulator of sigma subunit)
MNRLQYIYRKVINSVFGDIEVFFGLPQKWKIRGALAILLLYLAVVALFFMFLYPSHAAGSQSIVLIAVGYVFFFFGISIVVLPIVIPRYQKYPAILVTLSVFSFIVAFNILLGRASGSVDTLLYIAFYTGILSIAFGSRLYSNVIREVSAEKARIDTEIKLAQRIQTDLLPVIDIREGRFHAYGKTVNAHEVGGDFFDVIKLNDKQIAFCVGDVSGHNIAAGLIMGIVKSAFRTELRYNDNLSSIAGSLNKTVIEQRSKGMFVSFAAGLIDFATRDIEIINAGHPPIIRICNNNIDTVCPEGAALGLSDQMQFKSMKLDLNPGDTFICYSDGIIEARNNSGEEFGPQRLIHTLRISHDDKNARDVYELVFSEVETFSEDTLQIDDITVLVLSIK